MPSSIGSEYRATRFDPGIPPAVEIAGGTTIRVETDDSVYERLAAGESIESVGIENLNVVTGPIAISDAEPGDALRIDILSIEIARAWTAWLPDFGPLGNRVAASRVRQLRIDGAFVEISNRLRVPLQPSIHSMPMRTSAPACQRGLTVRRARSCSRSFRIRTLCRRRTSSSGRLPG